VKVLIVDDNRDAADSLCLLLKMKGYDARAAYSGPDAVAAADQQKPDVVLLDIGMPQMSGYDVVRELRHHTRAPRPRVYALTAYTQVSDRIAAKQAGFDGHLPKPVDLDQLFSVLGAPPG
jgi:two-component system CheB/CheR fusion protein